MRERANKISNHEIAAQNTKINDARLYFYSDDPNPKILNVNTSTEYL